MTQTKKNDTAFSGQTPVRILLILAAVGAVFAASYAYAQASNPSSSATTPIVASATGASTGAASASGAGCSCCGGSGEEFEGVTTVEGDVQRIAIDIQNDYVPNVVSAAAGIPIEITFAQADGCFEEIWFPDFGIAEDLTQGPVTITLPALDPGEYGWSCGMQMVFGRIVVTG